ncbi:MAG: hypothetical protein WD061_01605 [Candidatus Saccharimonadales bacterium]
MYEYDPSNREGNHPEDIIATIEDELELCHSDNTNYIDWLEDKYKNTYIYKAIESCSNLARKTDEHSLKFTDSGEVRQAFVGGNLLALRIAEQALGKNNFDKILVEKVGIYIPTDEVDDISDGRQLFEQLYFISDSLVGIANKGCILSHQYQDLIDQLETEIMSDARWQLYVRLGFGFLMYHLYQELEDRLQHEVDRILPQNWNAALKLLIEQESGEKDDG